jgi:hypothetical protein
MSDRALGNSIINTVKLIDSVLVRVAQYIAFLKMVRYILLLPLYPRRGIYPRMGTASKRIMPVSHLY